MSKKESKKEIVFLQAIADMEKNGQLVFGPKLFSAYCNENNLGKLDTADILSIQSIEDLPKFLKRKNIMILHLGKSQENTGTQFVLVKTKETSDFQSFFIEDEKIFNNKEKEEVYIPPDNYRENLLIYNLIPSFSETALISLAIDSGLLSKALNLDTEKPLPKIVNTQSTFTFEMYLHSSIKEIYEPHEHKNGQVEIDGMFLGYRDGQKILFVLEAKADKSKSLVKHKLVYSVLSILSVFNPILFEIPIVPVYLKIAKDDNNETFFYNIVECELPDPRKTIIAIDELMPGKHTYLSLTKEHLKIN